MASILVIEDDADIRALYCRILSQAGHAVTEAEDGNVGMRLYRQQHRDIVITDIIMPEKEGIETIMELVRESPDVRIIAISGGGQATPGSTCLHLAKRLGAATTLAKPFSKQELLNAVQEVLDNR